MNARQVAAAKKSVCRVMGVHRGINRREPYVVQEDVTFGGTAFFVNAPRLFGWDRAMTACKDSPLDGRMSRYKGVLSKMAQYARGKDAGRNPWKDLRFALTNFHVVDELADKTCLLSYPAHGHSSITAEVVYACPSLDVAILMVNPHGDHPMWFDAGDVRDFIETIPNLSLETEKPIKGSSQNVVAIGFPNLSKDYQLCEGCVSGREMGMIQCSLSLNGGNSGGPLMMGNKVIGICTASVTESEALALAGPIYQIVRFFRDWATYGESVILLTPSWGISTTTTTPDYLAYHGIESSIQGATLKRVLATGAVGKANVQVKDIVMGITSAGKRYNVDNYGLVSCPWTDKRVPIEDQEFILSLTPGDITFDVFHWGNRKHGKKSMVTHAVCPEVIHFKVRDMYHAWEEIPYAILGGMVFMNLCMQHLEAPEDEDEDAVCPPTQAIPLTNFLSDTLHMETAVVVTYIPPHTHVSSQRIMKPFSRVTKLNGKRVKDVSHMESLILDAVHAYNRSTEECTKQEFVVLEMDGKEKVYLNMKALLVREMTDSVRQYYPREKCMLPNMAVSRKGRKRRRVQV